MHYAHTERKCTITALCSESLAFYIFQLLHGVENNTPKRPFLTNVNLINEDHTDKENKQRNIIEDVTVSDRGNKIFTK